MAAPVVDSVTFDQPSYAPGQVITATVAAHGTNTAAQTDEFTGTVTDEQTGESGQGTGSLTVDFPDALTASASDAAGRDWAPGPVTADGFTITAKFTATA